MTTNAAPAAPAIPPTPPPTSSSTRAPAASAPRRVGWRSVFRPNAFVPSGVYRVVLLVETLLLLGGWLLLPSIIPGPARVFRALGELITQQALIGELWTSLSLNLEAIALSTVIALLISYATAIAVLRPIAGLVAKGRFLSLIGLTFIFTVFVGGGHPLKLALLTFGLTVFFVTAMADVVEQTPREKLDYARTLRMGEWHVLWEIIVLGNLGAAFDIMRQNAAMGWLMLTMVEGLVRSEGGIGRLLLDQEKHFSLAAILAVQLVFLLVGIGQDLFIRWLKTIFVPHAALSYQRDRA